MEQNSPAVGAPVEPTVMQHTPGPWTVSEINATGNVDEFYIFIEPNIAVIERKVSGSDQCDMNDARLIAAAPELLEALLTAEALLYAHGKPIDPAIAAALVAAGARAA